MRTTTSRRRLAISVGVVLTAVTAASLTVPAASAAPGPGPAAPVAVSAARTAAPAPVPFLASGGKLLGAGTTGFLSQDAEGTARWTSYADGASKVIAKSEGEYVFGSGPGSDIVVVAREVAEPGPRRSTPRS